MTLDKTKLKTEIAKTVTELRELKGIFRESKQPRLTWRHYGELRAMKGHATLLCAIAAHSRGKVHVQGGTLEEQAKLIGDAWREYEEAKAA